MIRSIFHGPAGVGLDGGGQHLLLVLVRAEAEVLDLAGLVGLLVGLPDLDAVEDPGNLDAVHEVAVDVVDAHAAQRLVELGQVQLGHPLAGRPQVGLLAGGLLLLDGRLVEPQQVAPSPCRAIALRLGELASPRNSFIASR